MEKFVEIKFIVQSHSLFFFFSLHLSCFRCFPAGGQLSVSRCTWNTLRPFYLSFLFFFWVYFVRLFCILFVYSSLVTSEISLCLFLKGYFTCGWIFYPKKLLPREYVMLGLSKLTLSLSLLFSFCGEKSSIRVKCQRAKTLCTLACNANTMHA